MGRAKLDMELISKEKARNITYQKRKRGLMKKAYELTTLCNIPACMIIYGPKLDDRPIDPEIWPTNPNDVHSVINIYREKESDSGKRTVDLSNFFKDRKKKIEEEVAKIRRKNVASQYPTWDDQINNLSESQLRGFLGALEKKSQVLKARAEMGINNRNEPNLIEGSSGMIDYTYTPSIHQNHHPYIQRGSGIELKPLDMVHYPSTTTHHDHAHPTVQINQNSMMTLMMNGHDDDYGGASSSNGGYAQYKGPHHCDQMAGMLDSVVYSTNPGPLMRYYARSLHPMQAQPQMHDHQMNNNIEERY